MGWGWGQGTLGLLYLALGRMRWLQENRNLEVPLIFSSRDRGHLKVSRNAWPDVNPTPGLLSLGVRQPGFICLPDTGTGDSLNRQHILSCSALLFVSTGSYKQK